MLSHRVNEVMELLHPFWLKHPQLNLVEVLSMVAEQAGHKGELDEIKDDLIVYQLKMAQTQQGEMIPGLAKDSEADFKQALLASRGID